MWNWIKQIIILAGIIYLATQLGAVFASAPRVVSLAQTVPSRTPTPSADATDTPAPPPTSPSGGENPTPISSPVPSVEASPIASSTLPPIAPTPEGGYLPTAEPCGQQPTVISLTNQVNVRRGPGQEYETIAKLIYLEVRPIIGRTDDAPWWQIRVSQNQIGWVADIVVRVHGDTQHVPRVSPPPINGNTPTPAAIWNPTPNPTCPVVTWTPTVTNTPLPATATTTLLPPATDTPTSPTQTAEPTVTTILVAVPTVEITPGEVPAFTPLSTLSSPNNTPSDTSSWLLYGGIGFLLLGTLAFFLRRR